MDFGRQRGFLFDGEDPPMKMGRIMESYFLKFIYAGVAKDFVGVGFFHSHRYIRSSVSPLKAAYLDLFKWQNIYLCLFSIALFVFVRPRLALSAQSYDLQDTRPFRGQNYLLYKLQCFIGISTTDNNR